MERMAGFSPEDIFYICNNVSPEEMQYAIDEARIVMTQTSKRNFNAYLEIRYLVRRIYLCSWQEFKILADVERI